MRKNLIIAIFLTILMLLTPITIGLNSTKEKTTDDTLNINSINNEELLLFQAQLQEIQVEFPNEYKAIEYAINYALDIDNNELNLEIFEEKLDEYYDYQTIGLTRFFFKKSATIKAGEGEFERVRAGTDRPYYIWSDVIESRPSESQNLDVYTPNDYWPKDYFICSKVWIDLVGGSTKPKLVIDAITVLGYGSKVRWNNDKSLTVPIIFERMINQNSIIFQIIKSIFLK